MQDQQQAIADFIKQKVGADQVTIKAMEKLSGGAIQENWLLDAQVEGGDHAGLLEAVLRADAPSGVSTSASRQEEFALLSEAFKAKVTVPEPLWMGDPEILGRDFFIMRRVAGTAAGHKLVKDPNLGGDKEALAEELGKQLARIHTITPPNKQLDFLDQPEGHPAQHAINQYRTFLDEHRAAHPALELVMRWMELNLPESNELVLAHRDYRTGNYMVDETGLTAILDWEFTTWSDPLDDIGWFCARCWRFGQYDKEAGGIGSREAFYKGYEDESGRSINRDDVFFWEMFATLRWAIIAIQQGERHVSNEEPSLELALTAHIVPELELELLRMLGKVTNQPEAVETYPQTEPQSEQETNEQESQA